MFSDLFERAGLAAIETKAKLEDLALAFVERSQQASDLVGQQRGGATSNGDSAERSSTTSPNSASPSSRNGSDSDSGSAAKRNASVTLSSGISTSSESSASVAGRPSFSSRAGAGLLQAGERVASVDRQPDRATSVGDAPGDRLADPPRGIRRELEALAPVELLDGVHQAEVALLDQVEEGQPGGWYFLAIDTTKRRLDCTNVRSASSPSRAWRRSSRLRAGVSSFPRARGQHAPRSHLQWPAPGGLRRPW